MVEKIRIENPIDIRAGRDVIRVWDDNVNDTYDEGEHLQIVLASGHTIGVANDRDPTVQRILQQTGQPSLSGISLLSASSFLGSLYALELDVMNGFRMEEHLKRLTLAAQWLGGPTILLYRKKIAEFQEVAFARARYYATEGLLNGTVDVVISSLDQGVALGYAIDHVPPYEERIKIVKTAFQREVQLAYAQAEEAAMWGRTEKVAEVFERLYTTATKLALPSPYHLDEEFLRATLDEDKARAIKGLALLAEAAVERDPSQLPNIQEAYRQNQNR